MSNKKRCFYMFILAVNCVLFYCSRLQAEEQNAFEKVSYIFISGSDGYRWFSRSSPKNREMDASFINVYDIIYRNSKHSTRQEPTHASGKNESLFELCLIGPNEPMRLYLSDHKLSNDNYWIAIENSDYKKLISLIKMHAEKTITGDGLQQTEKKIK
jgi:hypothetical protein